VSEALLKELHGKEVPLPIAYLEQDHFRNNILSKHPNARGLSAGLLKACTAAAIREGTHVLLEGILNMNNYSDMFNDILTLPAPTRVLFFYLDVPLEETKVRHNGRPKRDVFGSEKLDKWFASAQRSGLPGEIVIPHGSSVQETVATICAEFYRETE
jgi:hypothetical protein